MSFEEIDARSNNPAIIHEDVEHSSVVPSHNNPGSTHLHYRRIELHYHDNQSITTNNYDLSNSRHAHIGTGAKQPNLDNKVSEPVPMTSEFETPSSSSQFCALTPSPPSQASSQQPLSLKPVSNPQMSKIRSPQLLRVDLSDSYETIPKTPESAFVPSFPYADPLDQASSPQESSSTKPVPKPRKFSAGSSSNKSLSKLKEVIHKLCHPKFDIDVSKFHVPASKVPEVYPELLSVNFYGGRFIPNEDQYDPKPKQIEFTDSDKKVSIEQLFFQCKLQNFISIVGYPGSGKTTLSKRLARHLNQNGDFLALRIPFMNMSNCEDEKLTLTELLLGDVNFILEPEEKLSVFKWMQNHPENCFFIFDGFDQVNWNLIENVKISNYDTLLTYQELMSNLCLGMFLCNCHIVFTSRPHAMLEIPQKCRPKQTYFIRDLTSESMKKLFDAIINDEQTASKLWNKLTVNTPHLESLCHNPLMLQLYLQASLGLSHHVSDISTMTRIFQVVLENLKVSGHAISLTDEITIKLAKIAFKATENKTVLLTTDDLVKENLSSRKVQDIIVTLIGSNRTCGLMEGNRQLYFSHQTFQEFFAALYITHQMPLKNFISFVQNNLLSSHWSVVVQFLSGLLLDPYMNKACLRSVQSRISLNKTIPTRTKTLQKKRFRHSVTSLQQCYFHQPPEEVGTMAHTSYNTLPSSRSVSSLSQKSKFQMITSNLQSFLIGRFSRPSVKISKPSPLLPIPHQPGPIEKQQKREIFVIEINRKLKEVSANHNRDCCHDAIILMSKILLESSDNKIIKEAGSYCDGGVIWMKSSDTKNDFHGVTFFVKSMQARVDWLDLSNCNITSNRFRPWVEAIKSMPGSIVHLLIDNNLLASVDDVIAIVHKIEREVGMRNCLDDGNGRSRPPNMEERARLQDALDGLDNKNLKLWVDGDAWNPTYLRHRSLPRSSLLLVTFSPSSDG